LPRIFTVNVDGRAIIAFNAGNEEEARGIAALPEFRSDLEELTSQGMPICSGASRITLRSATPTEIGAFNSAMERTPALDATTFVFLIEVDGLVVSVVIPQGCKCS